MRGHNGLCYPRAARRRVALCRTGGDGHQLRTNDAEFYIGVVRVDERVAERVEDFGRAKGVEDLEVREDHEGEMYWKVGRLSGHLDAKENDGWEIALCSVFGVMEGSL